MSHKTAVKVFEIISYVLIIGATVIYFAMKGHPLRLILIMALIAIAIAARWAMERHRFRACEEELDMAQEDLRRLTLLLAEEKKKNNSNNQ